MQIERRGQIQIHFDGKEDTVDAEIRSRQRIQERIRVFGQRQGKKAWRNYIRRKVSRGKKMFISESQFCEAF